MSTGTLSDDQFVEAFESGKISSKGFHHVDHIRLAWIYVTISGWSRHRKKSSRVSVISRRFMAPRSCTTKPLPGSGFQQCLMQRKERTLQRSQSSSNKMFS